jgi:hypothetical protein
MSTPNNFLCTPASDTLIEVFFLALDRLQQLPPGDSMEMADGPWTSEVRIEAVLSRLF